MSANLQNVLDQWVSIQQAGGRSERTIKARVEIVRLLHLRTGVDPLITGWQPLAAFLSTPGWSDSTRSTYYVSLRSWFKYLVVMDIRLDDPTVKLTAPRRPKGEPRPVLEEQLRTVLGSRMHRRTKAMILLGSYQGLRCFEIAKIRGEDLVGDRLRVMGKGGKRASVPLHEVIEEIAILMPAKGYWFPAENEAGHILPKSVSQIISTAIRRSGVDATAHQLRHRFVTEVLRAPGSNHFTAQRAARHSSPATTAIYAAILDTDVEAAVRALPRVDGVDAA